MLPGEISLGTVHNTFATVATCLSPRSACPLTKQYGCGQILKPASDMVFPNMSTSHGLRTEFESPQANSFKPGGNKQTYNYMCNSRVYCIIGAWLPHPCTTGLFQHLLWVMHVCTQPSTTNPRPKHRQSKAHTLDNNFMQLQRDPNSCRPNLASCEASVAQRCC